MVIVAGHLIVDPADRERQLAAHGALLETARAAPGCLDFSVSADLIDPARINVFERWESQADVEAFRGDGPGDDQQSAVVSGSVAEYDVADVRVLIG